MLTYKTLTYKMLTYKMLVYKMFTYKLQQAEQLKYAPKVKTFGAYFLRQYAVLNCCFSNVHISADCVLCIRVIMQPTVGYGAVTDVFPAKSVYTGKFIHFCVIL